MKKKKKHFEIIKKESANLEFIVDDFLDFARLQNGESQLNYAMTSVEKGLMELYDSYQTKAVQRHIHFEFKPGEALGPRP